MSVNKTELLKELRALTQAGMLDCKKSLEETDWDLQKAVDLVKARGLQNTTRQEGKIAAEGVVRILNGGNTAYMVEVNCQTDFVAKSPDFSSFVDKVLIGLRSFMDVSQYPVFDLDQVSVEEKTLEQHRKELMSTTKENIVVRRWWIEQIANVGHIATYTHPNEKIGVMVSFGVTGLDHPLSGEFLEFADNTAMQIAAMNPLTVSKEKLSDESVARQKTIFETQLTEAGKPQAAWAKILDGKFNKWHSDVCLLNQESVVTPKNTVEKLLNDLQKQLGATIKIYNFQRCSVGDGVEKPSELLAEEVAKMTTQVCTPAIKGG